MFDDPDVIHVDGKVDPRSDMETINTELILADLQTIEKAIPRIEKEVKIKKREAAELAAIKAAQAVLERGDTIFSSVKSDKLEMEHLKELSLLTAKPFIYVFNSDEGILGSSEKQAELRASWPLRTPSSSMRSSNRTSLSWTRRKPAKCWR
ncbi:ribosome-binding ATPase YchF [Arthrobacter sp. Hiyo6]|nr:ribosome-binding ATPase YchF [Arthrobacter sp. Hiyo6]